MTRADIGLELALAGLLVVWAAAHAWRKASRRGAVQFTDVAFWATAFNLGGGPWIAWAYGGTPDDVAPSLLVACYAAIALHMLGLRLIGRWARRTNAPDHRGATLGAVFRPPVGVPLRTLLPCAALVWGIRVYVAVVYGVAFSGSLAERVLDIPYSVYVVLQLSDLFAAGLVAWIGIALFSGARIRRVALLLLCLEFGRAFLAGRGSVLAVLVFLACGWLAAHRSLRLRHAVAALAAAVVLVGWVFPAFIALRMAHQRAPSRGELQGLVEALADSRRDPGDDDFRENMAERPMIVRFNHDILERQATWGPMWGRALLSTFLWSIPSSFSPEKTAGLKAEEAVLEHYALPIVDRGGNWPAFGCADFGPIGGLVTGLLLGGALVLLSGTAARVRGPYPFVALCLAAGALQRALAVETQVTGTWVQLRNVAILLALAACLRRLRGIRARPDPATPARA